MTPDTPLERSVADIESRLAALGEALRLHPETVAAEAAELQAALAALLGPLRRGGPLPPPLRERLTRAGSQVGAQRAALARAGAALDRAIDVLLPGTAPRVAYSATGLNERPARGGMLQA